MYRNVQQCIGIVYIYYHAKFGTPSLKNDIGMYRNVLECIGMYRNVLECIAMYKNGLDLLTRKISGF